jgi:hypothetical protein
MPIQLIGIILAEKAAATIAEISTFGPTFF